MTGDYLKLTKHAEKNGWAFDEEHSRLMGNGSYYVKGEKIRFIPKDIAKAGDRAKMRLWNSIENG
jgi:hypothetical protein